MEEQLVDIIRPPKRKMGGMPLEKRMMLDASLPVLTGQVLWLDAADATTIFDTDGDDAATGTGGSNNGFSGNVALWADKSTSNFNVSGIGAAQPVYAATTLNGLNTITFDGVNDRLFNNTSVVSGSNYTSFVVFSRDSFGGREGVFELGQNPSRNAIFINNSLNKYGYYMNGTFYDSTSAYTPGNYDLVSMRQSGTAANVRVDGSLEVSTTTAMRTTTTGIYVGDDSTSGDFLDGQISEIITYNRALSSDEVHDVENYLATKWGLTIANSAPVLTNNAGITLDELTSAPLANLSATDADNTDANICFTITDATDFGHLYNSNTSLNLGLGDSFTKGDIDNGYIIYYHDVANTTLDSMSYTISDGYSTSPSYSFAMNITPVNEAPVISGWTQVSIEDFEFGATGWSDNTTTNGGSILTNYLGRHSSEGGVQDTYKTYTLSGTQDYATISFDFYRIDSWDTENFIIYVDDVAVYNVPFTTSYASPSDGSSGAVSWIIQKTTPFSTNFAHSGWNDQTFHFSLTIQSTAASVKLGFSSTLNQAVNDEAWGVDNIIVSEVGSGGTPGNFQVSEQSYNGKVIGKISATDPDTADTLTYSIAGGTGLGIFSINSTTGDISVANASALDYETTTSYTLDIVVTDNGAPVMTDTETITIDVLDVPENTAPVVTGFGTTSVNENSSAGTVIGTVTSTDAESNAVTYSITGGNTGSMFAIHSITGVITLAASPNFEDIGSYTLTVRGTDNGFGSLTHTTSVTININDVNEAPTLDQVTIVLNSDLNLHYSAATGNFYKLVTASANYATAKTNANASTLFGATGYLANITSAAENAFLTSFITSSALIGASDAATEGQWLWDDGPENGSLFWSGTSTGSAQNGFYTNWNGGEPNNSGNEDAAQLLTSGRWNDINAGSNSAYLIEWTGTDVLAALPRDTYSLNENSALNFSVGSIMGDDVDAGDTLTYAITGGTGVGVFSLNPSTGEITLSNVSANNFEVNNSFTLDVKVTDSGGLTDTKTITINVLDVNESPSQLNLTNQHVTENSSIGKIVGQFSTVDEDVADIHTYTILTNPGNKFSIVGQDLVLTGALDYEATQTISLLVRTDDGNGGTYDRIFKITVGDQMDTYVPTEGTNVTRTTGHDYKTTQTTKLSRSIVHDTFEGGEIGQQSSFYGDGNFFQIIREKTTFQIKAWVKDKIQSLQSKDRSLLQGVRSHDQSIANDVEDQNFESHYTNLRNVLEQLEKFSDTGDNEEKILDQENKEPNTPQKNPVFDDGFVDVMTYHERKQERLRQALLS